MSQAEQIIHGSLPILTEDHEISEGGLGELDSFSAEILVEWTRRNEDAAALGFTKGTAIPGYPALFVEGIGWKRSGFLGTGSVRGVGLSTVGERRKRRLAIAGQVVSIGPVAAVVVAWDENEKGEEQDGTPIERVKRLVPKVDSFGEPVYKTFTTPSGTFDRWNIKEAILTVTDTYFTTTEPDAAEGGTALTPPTAPTPPPYAWGDYAEEMRANFPAGWVLDNREIDEIYPGLWAVTDTFGYYHPAIPD
jgi:hypothetical protein